MKALGIGAVYSDLYDACENVKLLLILNNHKKYASVVDDKVFHHSENGIEILDSWGACTELYYCEDVKISTLGNMFN